MIPVNNEDFIIIGGYSYQRNGRIKERAYLARYLVKINVPPEMVQSDEGINAAWEEYLELIERFKEIHSSVNEQRKQVSF